MPAKLKTQSSTNPTTKNQNPLVHLRLWLNRTLASLPLWRELNWVAGILASPIYLVVRLTLLKWPSLHRFEWLLEAESLVTRAPVAVVIPFAVAIWRGGLTTNLGHIGTDVALYPLIAAVSSFNPFLGVCCAVAFGIADFIQKLFINDMYGAHQKVDYIGALLGYLISYSSVIVAGLAPGVASRILRRGCVFLVSRAWRADGATEQQHTPSLGEDLVSMAGSFATGYLMMQDVPPCSKCLPSTSVPIPTLPAFS